MKSIKKCLAVMMCFLCVAILFVGCAYKKYELVGIVKEGDSEITLIADLDDETKEYLSTNYGMNATIDLKSNNEFELEYKLTENGLTLTYTQEGTFELNEKENIIIFYTPNSKGEQIASTQQYLNGKIVYFDGVYFLAFK